MSEVYTKPTVPASRLAWGTTITGSIDEWAAPKRVGGFYNGEPVPAENLNFRWNLVGEWIQYTSAPVQRRFTSLNDGITATSANESFWVDEGTGYRTWWQDRYTYPSAYTDDGIITDLMCDSEYIFYCIGEDVSSVNPDTGSENTSYHYEIGSDVTSVYSDGNRAFCTVSGSTFHQLDRTDSDVVKVDITIPSAKEINGFKSNGYYGMGFLNETSQYVPLYRSLDSTAVYITDIDASFGVNDVALSDSVGFCACQNGPSQKVNLRSFSLNAGVAGWTGEGGDGFYDGYSVCTDGERVYLVHERNTYNVTCFDINYGQTLWTADCLAYLPALSIPRRCFVDDKYLYVATVNYGENGTYVLDKHTGDFIKVLLTSTTALMDSDAWNLYGMARNTDSYASFNIGGTPKQFFHATGTNRYRRPFAKLGLPLGN